MIIDTIDNLKFYVKLNPRIQDVLLFLEEHDLNEFENQVVEIEGRNVFANFSTAKGKKQTEAQIETHDKMLDIQIPISCPETMGFIPRVKLQPQKYNQDNDMTLYNECPELYFTLLPGEFAIFFPQDGHAPCISDNNYIKKVIFKVKL